MNPNQHPHHNSPRHHQPIALQDNIYPGYQASGARVLGVLQILCGLAICLSQIGVSVIQTPTHVGFSGFWAAPIFLLAGSFGVQSSVSKSKCTVTATLVLSIISAILSLGPIIQGSVGVTVLRIDLICKLLESNDCKYTSEGYLAISAVSIMLLCGIVEGIVAIIASAFCCQGCCGTSQPGFIINGLGASYPGPGMQANVMTYNQHAVPVAVVNMGSYPHPADPWMGKYPHPADPNMMWDHPQHPKNEKY